MALIMINAHKIGKFPVISRMFWLLYWEFFRDENQTHIFLTKEMNVLHLKHVKCQTTPYERLN